jgi:hypothetical protein
MARIRPITGTLGNNKDFGRQHLTVFVDWFPISSPTSGKHLQRRGRTLPEGEGYVVFGFDTSVAFEMLPLTLFFRPDLLCERSLLLRWIWALSYWDFPWILTSPYSSDGDFT